MEAVIIEKFLSIKKIAEKLPISALNDLVFNLRSEILLSINATLTLTALDLTIYKRLSLIMHTVLLT